jgi:hypothetical protein
MAVESPRGEGAVARLPAFLHEPFSAAMSQTLLLPAFFALFGVGAALFLLGFGDNRSTVFDDPRAADPEFGAGDESFTDDDEYLEFTVSWDDAEPVSAKPEDAESATEPLALRVPHVLHAPADVWHDEPVETWHHMAEDEWPPVATAEPTRAREPDRESWRWEHRPPEGQRDILDFLLADDKLPPAEPVTEPIGFAHNGFHVDDEQSFQPVDRRRLIADPGAPVADAYGSDLSGDDHSASGEARHRVGDHHERPSRHRLREEESEPRQFWFESHGRHSRDDPGDASRHGRHSSPWRD